MRSRKFEDFLCHTKSPVLLRRSFMVSQKCQPPSLSMHDVIHEQPLLKPYIQRLELKLKTKLWFHHKKL